MAEDERVLKESESEKVTGGARVLNLVTCQNCGAHFSTPEAAGSTITCPACRKSTKV